MLQKRQQNSFSPSPVCTGQECSNYILLELSPSQRGLEDIVEKILDEKFPNLGNGTSVLVLEAERIPSKIIKGRKIPTHMTVKFTNCKFRE